MSETPSRRFFGPEPRINPVLESPGWWPPHEPTRCIVIAGPCSVESKNQIMEIACALKGSGVTYLRGGVARAGTYPPIDGYEPFSMEKFLWLQEAAQLNGMGTIVEVMSMEQSAVGKADACQIGARRMQDYELLASMSSVSTPVFLKRNMGSTLNEFLGAASYLVRNKKDVALIERGSSTFMNHVRWDLSISIIAAVKCMTKIPILVDASHGTGRRDLVEPMTLAGIAAGADGLLIETHYDPDKSATDAEQAVDIETAKRIIAKARRLKNIDKSPLKDSMPSTNSDKCMICEVVDNFPLIEERKIKNEMHDL